ncbi:hypothetical protein NX80_004595 [Xanthomonas vasicola pv. arecae]|uniref:type III secretion system effector XopAV n=1 Tax=Xanthomonas vasicola TaxID=56459 RepID=UPI00052D6015|nr:type III secretion system effector XopAV [Xanthomonas vasicola]AZR25881.1 hypothetical protein NX80_004595 [Xanthomonas vasicola pv. arecae]
MERIDSGEVTMQPLALTSVTRRGARREQQEGATVADAGPSAPASDPHANTQLVQELRRLPMREAPLRAARTPPGVRIARFGRLAAHICAAPVVSVFGFNVVCAAGVGAYGYATHDEYSKTYARISALGAVGSAVAFGGVTLADYLADRYIEAQARADAQRPPVQKAQRASELETTVACLDAAVEMVTMPEEDGPYSHLTLGEQAALAKDLLNLITAERSRLPPELWSAASGVRDPHVLVERLLAAAAARAAKAASTSSTS